jgi:hypothetical protein
LRNLEILPQVAGFTPHKGRQNEIHICRNQSPKEIGWCYNTKKITTISESPQLLVVSHLFLVVSKSNISIFDLIHLVLPLKPLSSPGLGMISSTPVVSALGLKAGASTLKPQGNQQGWQEAVFANFRGLLMVQLPKICGNLNFRGSLIRSLMIRKMWKDLSLFFEFRKMSAVLFNLRGICLADIKLPASQIKLGRSFAPS